MKKFERIFLDIEEKIKAGIFPTSSLLPSENELADYYHVSRGTIRQALKKLETHGYIYKRQGKGNVVLNHSAFTLPISGIKSYKEIANEHQLDVTTHVLKNEKTAAPSIIVDKMNIDPKTEFIHLVRLREIEGDSLIIDEDYVLTSIVPSISQSVAEDSIYEYFEEELELSISYAHKEFFAQKANNWDQKYFGISADDYVMTVNSFVYLEDTSFFQYTCSRHRLESFKFEEIARRQ